MSKLEFESSAVTTVQKKGSYYNVYEGSHFIGSYSTFSSGWTKAATYLAGGRDYQDDIRLKGDITVDALITVPEYTMVRGPAKINQGYSGTLFTDEQIGSNLNADEITMMDLNIELDSAEAASTAIHMCARDSTFERLKIWGSGADEAVIFESKGGATTTRCIGVTLSNIWIGRHYERASDTGGLYFKASGTNGAAETHMYNIYLINNYGYQMRLEYGATYDIKDMHVTGYGNAGTDGVQVVGAYDLEWTGGCFESIRRNGIEFTGGAHQCTLNDILFFDNGNETNDTYSDIYGSSAIGIKVIGCKFRDYGGQANNPKYNIEIVGAGDDAWKGAFNYYDTDYYVTAAVADGSGSFTDTESEAYVS